MFSDGFRFEVRVSNFKVFDLKFGFSTAYLSLFYGLPVFSRKGIMFPAKSGVHAVRKFDGGFVLEI